MSDQLKDTLKAFVVPVQILKDMDLNIYEKMVYIVLRSFANAHGDSVMPSYTDIAGLAGISRRQAIKVVEALIQKQYIERKHEFKWHPKIKKVTKDNNSYTLKLPSAGDALVHDMHHPSAQDAPPLVHDMHHPSAQDAHISSLSSKDLKDLKIEDDDDDRGAITLSVYERFKRKDSNKGNWIGKTEFDKVVKRASKVQGIANWEAFLVRAVQNEIANLVSKEVDLKF